MNDTIARLQAYQEAGADVLYAPALDRPEDLRELLPAVDLPVSVLARRGTPPAMPRPSRRHYNPATIG